MHDIVNRLQLKILINSKLERGERSNDIPLASPGGIICLTRLFSVLTLSDEKYICENVEGTISCSDGVALDLIYAFYGRSSSDLCPHPNPANTMANINCNSTKDILSIVKNECKLQSSSSSCTIVPSNGLFDGDPCQGTYKYLTVGYSCSNSGWCNLSVAVPKEQIPVEFSVCVYNIPIINSILSSRRASVRQAD